MQYSKERKRDRERERDGDGGENDAQICYTIFLQILVVMYTVCGIGCIKSKHFSMLRPYTSRVCLF